MNKTLTSTVLFAAALLLGGCSHAHTQAQVQTPAPAPVVVASAPTPPTPAPPVDQPDEQEPHGSPFKGTTWSLTTSESWIGEESEDGAGLLTIDTENRVKVMLVSKPIEKPLSAFAADVKKNLTAHDVKFVGQKSVKVDGVPAIEFATKQDNLKVWITVVETKETAYLFGCGASATNTAAPKVCTEVRKGLHFTK